MPGTFAALLDLYGQPALGMFYYLRARRIIDRQLPVVRTAGKASVDDLVAAAPGEVVDEGVQGGLGALAPLLVDGRDLDRV